MAGKEVTRKRNKSGQFVAGVSGNPGGRPTGSKNKVTLLKLVAEEAVRAGHADKMLEIADLIIEQALEGDPRSQKMVWDAIMSKGSVDDRAHATEKVEINIGTLAPQQAPEKEVGITIDHEDDDNA